MKVEIGESLGYSFLRHVKKCWLVQTNWKASGAWPKHLDGDALEREFVAIQKNLESSGSGFAGTLKGTATGKQFLRQAEIDIVGVRLDGSIYAVEVAFHEDGLHYSGNTSNNVLKKMLRTMLILRAYHPSDTKRHIYFAAPKVAPKIQQNLQGVFEWLRQKYPAVKWYLLTGDDFANKLLVPTLEKAKEAADTSELFMRSAKLLELGGLIELGDGVSSPRQESTPSASDTLGNESDQIQPLVRNLMQTLLDDSPSLLTERERRNLMDQDYCRDELDLKIDGLPLLRNQEEGVEISGHARYWTKVYGGRYLVTNNWWRRAHLHNAESLLSWVKELIRRNAGQPGVAELESCRAAFQNYLDHPE